MKVRVQQVSAITSSNYRSSQAQAWQFRAITSEEQQSQDADDESMFVINTSGLLSPISIHNVNPEHLQEGEGSFSRSSVFGLRYCSPLR